MSYTDAVRAKGRAALAKKYGPDYAKKIGALGGKKSKGSHLAGNPERARELGRLGGLARWKTGYCQRNHAMTPDNIYTYVTKKGYTQRRCKACVLAYKEQLAVRKQVEGK